MNILIKPENNLHKLSLSSFAWLGLTQVNDSSNCKYKRSKQWIRLSVFFVFFSYNHAKHCLILATFSAISQIHDSPRAFLVRYNPQLHISSSWNLRLQSDPQVNILSQFQHLIVKLLRFKCCRKKYCIYTSVYIQYTNMFTFPFLIITDVHQALHEIDFNHNCTMTIFSF